MTHLAFDVAAVILSILAGLGAYHLFLRNALERTTKTLDPFYFVALSLGSIAGAFLLGTANLYLTGYEIIGRSIVGAFFGAILTIELYKLNRGIRGSTGYMYVIPFCVIVIVGRLGCFFSGLDDHTHGIQSTLPWAYDFGDGISRHPVQLYESGSMLLFMISALFLFKTRKDFMIQNGFYLMAGFYGAQRFIWEFLKPYGDLALGLNIFQFTCLLLVGYSIFMIGKVKHGYIT